MSIGSGWCCKVILASGVIGGPWIKKSMLFFYFTSWKLGVFPSVRAQVGVCAYVLGSPRGRVLSFSLRFLYFIFGHLLTWQNFCKLSDLTRVEAFTPFPFSV